MSDTRAVGKVTAKSRTPAAGSSEPPKRPASEAKKRKPAETPSATAKAAEKRTAKADAKAPVSADGFETTAAGRVTKHRPELAGLAVTRVDADAPLTPGDSREYSDIDTLRSDKNLVVPLFPDLLVDPNGDKSFNRSMMKAIEDARSLVVIEGYDLNRDDLVDLLIRKARDGVEVVVLFDPAGTEREKKKSELLDRMRDAKLPNLHVAEYGLVPKTTKSGFEQILHVKKVITDSRDGTLVEHSGGINFSPNSIFNLDFGWKTEGLAVFDSLRHVVDHWRSTAGEFPFDLAKLPEWNRAREVVAAKLDRAKIESASVEMASAGKRPVPEPRKYSKKKLLERAQLGQKIIISAADALRPGVAKNLKMAAHNGGLVKVIEGALSDEDQEAFAKLKKELKQSGVRVFKEGDVVLEDSYFSLVCRELDAAVGSGASIEVAAFALSHPEIIDRLIAAHRAGSEVRVVVHDLEIDGNLINKKAMALLSKAGVPVRAVDKEVAASIAKERGTDPVQLKLHAKYLKIGDDRVLSGSANFSENGLGNNVEDGRMVVSRSVAKAASETLFEPLWAAAKEAHVTPLVKDGDRVPLLPRVETRTPIKDTVFVVMDLETTGFVPGHEDRILQMSARAVRLDGAGGFEVLGDFNQVVTPGTDPMGHPFRIPKRVSSIVGIDEGNLAERGAVPIREALPAFLAFIREQQEHGPVVLAGQNLPFDLRFLDYTLAREPLGQPADGGVVHHRLDAPYVDAIDVSKRLFPDEDAHNLDAHMERLGIPPDPDLPRHDAFADVVYTAEALAKLVGHGKLSTLGDLLPPDLIELTGPTQLFSSARNNAQALHELTFNDSGKLQLEVRDPRSGKLGGGRRVYDMQVTGRKNGRLEVAVTTGKGDRSETLRGFIDEAGVEFRSGGRVYHDLRAEGMDLQKPKIERAT